MYVHVNTIMYITYDSFVCRWQAKPRMSEGKSQLFQTLPREQAKPEQCLLVILVWAETRCQWGRRGVEGGVGTEWLLSDREKLRCV